MPESQGLTPTNEFELTILLGENQPGQEYLSTPCREGQGIG